MDMSIGDILSGLMALFGFAIYSGLIAFCVAYGWRKGKGE